MYVEPFSLNVSDQWLQQFLWDPDQPLPIMASSSLIQTTAPFQLRTLCSPCLFFQGVHAEDFHVSGLSQSLVPQRWRVEQHWSRGVIPSGGSACTTLHWSQHTRGRVAGRVSSACPSPSYFLSLVELGPNDVSCQFENPLLRLLCDQPLLAAVNAYFPSQTQKYLPCHKVEYFPVPGPLLWRFFCTRRHATIKVATASWGFA